MLNQNRKPCDILWSGPDGATDGSQGQARSAQPLGNSPSDPHPEGVRDFIPVCRPSGAQIFLDGLPGAARFALAPGYHLSPLRGEVYLLQN